MICTKKRLSVSPEVVYRTHPNYICTTIKDMFLLGLWKATCYTNTPTTPTVSTTTSMLASTPAAGGDTYCSEQGPQLESGTNLQRDKKKSKKQKITCLWKSCFKVYRPGTQTHADTFAGPPENKSAFSQTHTSSVCVAASSAALDLKSGWHLHH